MGGDDPRRLAIDGPCLHDQQAERVGRDRTAGREKAQVADFHEAVREHVLEEPVEKLERIECRGAWACTAYFSVGERDRAVLEVDDALVGDGHPEDIRGEGGEGGVAVGLCLTVDIPGDGPGLRIDLLSQTGLADVFLKERTVEGGERCDRDKAVGSGRAPCRAVLGEATARDKRVDLGVILQLSAPGMQDTSEPREVCPDEALILGQPLKGRGRRLNQGVVREALMRADEGTQGFRDSEGEEEVRPWELCVQVVLEPLLGCMRLALRTVAVATGMRDAVLPSTAWALREALSVMAALAVLDGADDLAVCEGQMGRTRKGFWGKGGADIAQGRHGRRPCMRALRRS